MGTSASDRADTMKSNRSTLDGANVGLRKLGGSLHWMHWMVVAMSLLLTFTASFLTRKEINDKTEARFDRQTDQAVSLVLERFEKYETSLWGGVAAIRSAGGDMTNPEWVTFADSLTIEERLPGINGIGVIHHVPPAELYTYLAEQRTFRPDYDIHPEHDEDVFLPISYIEPLETNAAAVGLDMAHEANRFDGVRRAQASGTAQITGPIVLVQDSAQTPGFLFFAPWYEGAPRNETERVDAFQGVVYAPFVVSELMSGALDETTREIGVRILDGDEILFDEHRPEVEGFDPDPLLTKEMTIPIYGREWTFDIWTDQTFRASASNSEPLLILLGGLFIDGLLFALFASMARSRKRARTMAEELTAELKENAASLEETNAELERFAYVASHDLRTPLRGISSLTTYLEEDLEDYMRGDDADPGVAKNLDRIRQQTNRMDGLIKGILDYSRIGGGDLSDVHPFSLHAAIDTIAADVGLSAEHVEVAGPDSWLLPAGIYLEQVLQNLIVNAVNHHDGTVEEVRITIDAVADGAGPGGWLELSIRDNGPGIDPDYHDRIFAVFERLDAGSSGTGIGLAIVKRMVESHGGTVSVDSTPGNGATFTVRWPATAITEANNAPAEEVTA